jgi:hypothetical protein
LPIPADTPKGTRRPERHLERRSQCDNRDMGKNRARKRRRRRKVERSATPVTASPTPTPTPRLDEAIVMIAELRRKTAIARGDDTL